LNFFDVLNTDLKAFLPNRKKIQEATGEKLSNFYLMQSILMAIQHGNAVCTRGCPKNISTGLESLFNFHAQEAEML
jgi:predicted exporter